MLSSSFPESNDTSIFRAFQRHSFYSAMCWSQWVTTLSFSRYGRTDGLPALSKCSPGQSIISTGPYGIVRHSMYSGDVLMILATPLALGWAFVCAALLCGIIAARLLDEGRYLSKNLSSYQEYCRKIRYRLIPYVR